MSRAAHHRTSYRLGPHHSWLQRKTYHLSKLFKAVRLGLELVRNLRPVGPGLFALDRLHLMPQAREAFAAAELYLDDETGEVWN
jgi:hypothetical protein